MMQMKIFMNDMKKPQGENEGKEAEKTCHRTKECKTYVQRKLIQANEDGNTDSE